MRKIIRPGSAMGRLGIRKSAFYNWVQKGLLPPPFKLGKRAAGWLEEEIEEIVALMVAGRTEEEIRARVKELVLKRCEGFAKNES